MANPLEKIIDLIKKTGDNCIVLDALGNPAYVVVDFADYQNLILGKAEVSGLSEEQLLDKINRDVANWKASSQAEKLNNWQAVESSIAEISKSKPARASIEKPLNLVNNTPEKPTEDQKYYFEPID